MKKLISIILLLSIAIFNGTAYAERDFELPDNDAVSSNTGKARILLYQYNNNDPVSIEMGNFDNGGPGITDDGDLLVPLKIAVSFSYIPEEKNNTIYLSNEYANIEIPINNDYAVVNGTKIDFKHSYINNQVYFSYEYIPLLFNISSEWDADQNLLTLRENENTPVSDRERHRRNEGYAAVDETDGDTIEVRRIGNSQEDYSIEVTIGGQYIDFGADKPLIDDAGRTQVPIRYVAEALNCKVDWNDAEQTAIITTEDGRQINITIGSNVLISGGNPMEMDTKAIIVNDRTYIPIRFLGDAMGISVGYTWD